MIPRKSMEPKKQKQKSKLRRILEYDVNIGKYKQLLFENLVLMISSGLNVVTALEQYQAENKIKSLGRELDEMSDELRKGQPFWQILGKHKIVRGNLLDIVKVGEESGNLAKNLNIVLLQQRKDKEIKSKLANASLYPALVSIVLLVVGSVIAIFILPRLTEVYKSFNTELPTITLYLIAIGDFMDQYGTTVVPAFVVVVSLIVYFLFIYHKTSWIGQKILLRTPVIKTALIQLELSRFGYLYSSLLDSGFRVVDALDIIAESTSLRDYKKLYEFLAASIVNGDSFSQSFEQYKDSKRLFPMFARQALISGEQTAKLKEASLTVGETYQKEYDYTTANLYILLEPILLIIVWIGVFLMALAIILPIYNLMGNFSSISSSGPAPTPVVQAGTETVQYAELISDGTQLIPIYVGRGGTGLRFSAEPGTIYRIISKDAEWYQIDLTDGTIGWVEQKYVRESPPEKVDL